jgi:predicted nucleotidyltransferase component of viral defense system
LINRLEILDFAREFGLSANVVEKDYVIGWLLAGIGSHPDISQSWIFKGGTCLKKCYFETFRFSEDLDFTLTDPGQLSEEFLVRSFQQISDWVYAESGIEIPQDTVRFEIYRNPRGNLSAQGRVGYRGPMGRRGDAPRVKLDLTNDEVLVLEPVVREVHHPYSDRPENGIHIACYCIEEVFAEKFRALAERERPRDLYDVVHLYRHDELKADREAIFDTLQKKCAFKGIAVPTLATLEGQSERNELESEWGNMLGHQLPALPPFEQFWKELPRVFGWLEGRIEKVARPAIQVAAVAVDEDWRPPSMASAWHTSTPLEGIRFAAANRLCVELIYQGSSRLIEPYSLRRTRDGNLLLFAVKSETGEDRSYRVDRVQGARVTEVPFAPRYLVELTPTGPIAPPQVARRSSGFPALSTIRPRAVRAGSAKGTSRIAPKYVFQCSACGKKFTHTSYISTLNPHKDKHGYPCSGRIGIYVTTK